MKKLISLVLAAVLLAFLILTNPTTEEFAAWYGQQTVADADASILEQALSTLSARLASSAERENYLVCSVFTYDGCKTLGIGLRFFPLDDLTEQIADLRSDFVTWLEDNTK